MSCDYSENILVQEVAGHLLETELGWEVKYAYNTEVLGETGTFGRKSYHEILLPRYFCHALETMLRGICKKEYFLDLLENFILFDHS